MISPRNAVVLCSYRYDPVDRVAVCFVAGSAELQRFYLKSRLATEIKGQVQRTLMQHDDLLLAQRQQDVSSRNITLLATDQQRSVLHGVAPQAQASIVYTPYGHHAAQSGMTRLPGFNGETRDPVTGHYLLGNGYRAFNPVLMRFNCPDNLSPFAEGGVNAYAYCTGDPINVTDPTGHFGHTNFFLGVIQRVFSRWSRVSGALISPVSAPQMILGVEAFKRSVPIVSESTTIKTQLAPSRSAFEMGSSVVVAKGPRVKVKVSASASGPVPATSRAAGKVRKLETAHQGKPWTISTRGMDNRLDATNPRHQNAQRVFDEFESHIRTTGTYPANNSPFKLHKFGGARDQFDDGPLFELSLSVDKRAVFTVDLNKRVVHVRAVGVHWRKGSRNNR